MLAAERNAPTEILLLRARAYHERRYDGNLLDLVQPYGFPVRRDKAQRRGLRWLGRHFLGRGAVRWRKLPLLHRLAKLRGFLDAPASPPVYIDNRALDGFLRGLPKDGCRGRDCESCGYCRAWAGKVVRIDDAWRAECHELYATTFRDLETGSLWGL